MDTFNSRVMLRMPSRVKDNHFLRNLLGGLWSLRNVRQRRICMTNGDWNLSRSNGHTGPTTGCIRWEDSLNSANCESPRMDTIFFEMRDTLVFFCPYESMIANVSRYLLISPEARLIILYFPTTTIRRTTWTFSPSTDCLQKNLTHSERAQWNVPPIRTLNRRTCYTQRF